MFNHITIGTNDLAASTTFYDALFAPLGIKNLGAIPERMTFYGTDAPQFMVTLPYDGGVACHANGGTIGFKAATRSQVDAFHAIGCANGGTCEGAPGNREAGPPGNYAAYVRDMFGNKLVAITYSSE
jgi:catechol 2,3-dioxygenase-like lactoylglutathione lyase family enzyme